MFKFENLRYYIFDMRFPFILFIEKANFSGFRKKIELV